MFRQPAARFAPVSRAAPARGWMHRDEAIMGTSIHVECWVDDRATGEAAIAAVIAEMHRIDAAMSPYKEASELSRVNREAAAGPVPISGELFELIARSISFSELSDGAFDITYAAAGHLYDYRRGIRPDDETLAAARAAIGYRNLILDPAAKTLRFARAGVRIDLGGFAKGHAVDRGAEILRRFGIASGIVTAGGDSRIVGDRQGRPWTIGIRNPRSSGVAALLPLEDCAVSTSGDYERYFEADGVRHHHVLDPRTGVSPRGVHGVTIVAPDGLTAEALSKTVFVRGADDGLRLVETQRDIDAVIVDADGALHFSRGLQPGSALR
jgi:thiamine biosynthesis lipoprotein